MRKRFDGIFRGLEERLEGARKAEIARREQLIEAVGALRDEPELGRAIAEARRLQERWRDEASTARLQRSDEQALWKRFRAGCDAVFARREAQRAEQESARAQGAATRTRLLDELRAALGGSEPGAIEHALQQFRTAWESAERLPRELAGELAGRARELEQQALARVAALRRERRGARYAVMARKAALAAAVEAAAASGGDAEAALARAREDWESAGPLQADAERALSARLSRAAEATTDALARGSSRRAELLLDLELALDLPTPAHLLDARRARQLSGLREHFSSGSARADPERMIIEWHATAASGDTEQDARMESVVRRIIERTSPASEGAPRGPRPERARTRH